MAMQRTPPCGDVTLPSAKLGAVTRKKNEIEELLHNHPEDVEPIRKLYTEYLVKVENLLESCNTDELGKWVAPHKEAIDVFRRRIEDWIAIRRVKDVAGKQTSEPSRSVRSHRSSASSTSSARIRLAERKAKITADKALLEKAKSLECEELALKREYEKNLARLEDLKRRAEVERAEFENEILEAELDKIDKGSSIGSCQSVQALVDVARSAPVVMPRVLEDGFCNEHTPSILQVLSRQNEISSNLVVNQQQNLLPKRDLQTFDGSDVTEFYIFMRNFEKMIETRCSDPSDRLSYLEQYTSGKARKLVKSCVNYDPETAYRQAKALLNEEFGSEFKVTHAYLDRLNRWPPIKNEDVEALQDLSIYLLRCLNYLESTSPCNPLHSPRELMNIVQKLPYKTREQWRRRTYQKQKAALNVDFGDLVTFIREEVALLKQPMFGQIADPLPPRKDKENKSKILATTLEDEKPSVVCECCGGSSHSLEQCTNFKARSFQEKSNFIKQRGLCFGCLCQGHKSRFCKKRKTCATCGGRHPTIMHDSTPRNAAKQSLMEQKRGCEAGSDGPPEPNACKQGGRSSISARASYVGGAGKVNNLIMCPIVAAKIRIKNGPFVTINVALDSHSSDSWIREDLIEQLGAHTRPTRVFLSTMENVRKEVPTSILTDLEICPLDGSKSTLIPILFTKPSANWPFSKEDIPTYDDVESLPYLERVPFDFVNVDVGILLGMNSPGLIKTFSTVDGEWEQPFASLHWLGWAFNGPVSRRKQSMHCKRSRLDISSLEADIESYFSHDYFEPEDQPSPSVEDERWFAKVKHSLRRTSNGKYEIALPFYDDDVSFPMNKGQVEARFTALQRKFRKDECFLDEYRNFMSGLLRKDYIEKVPDSEIAVPDGKVWYLTHHAVYHRQKKKIRVVFDCSLKFSGVSLNDKLMQGPDLTNNLTGVLLRFRENSCAFTADIEQMFYQVRVPSEHANFLRFFWFDESTGLTSEYRLKVHVFGARSSPSVANFALRQAAVDFSTNPQTTIAVFRNFYVDDILKSVTCVDKAAILYRDIANVLLEGGFNLTGFCANSQELVDSVLGVDGSSIVKPVHEIAEYAPNSKTLGLTWDTRKDLLMYRFDFPGQEATRREVLRVVASIYDPLGVASPAVVRGRKIFQECCRLKLAWDDVLPPILRNAWINWVDSIRELNSVRIPRCVRYPKVVPDEVESVELHVFCDGSEMAYGAVAYARFVLSSHSEVSPPLFAKSRLTPLNRNTLKTIPRIELCSAKLGVEMACMLIRESQILFDKRFFWSDSMTVLGYIKNETRRFHRFVGNRVSFIRSHTSPADWNHVSSADNPADIISRGCTARDLSTSKLWNEGPSFLTKILQIPIEIPALEVDDVEIKNETTVFKAGTSPDSPSDLLLQSSSSWLKLKVKVAWLRRFMGFLKNGALLPHGVSLDELRAAERAILIYVQRDAYPLLSKEILNSSVKCKQLKKLNPFVDENGLIRVGGRLSLSSAKYSVRHPVLLPGTSRIGSLIAEETHRLCGHLGKSTVLSALRTKFWMVGASAVVRGVLRNCMICRKYQGKPMTQLMSDLPASRVKGDVPPFTHVGVDYFGPFVVTHGRKSEKRYGVIFTCMSSRAIHIEIAPSLSTDSFLNAFRRFISRRGNVSSITSDNGTNFVGAYRELKASIESWDKSEIERCMARHSVEWKFNTPYASNFGGVWERLIRIVRKVLSSLLSEQPMKLSDDLLATLMCETEAVVNNRPLTAVSDDPNDCNALTPNHLLLLNSVDTFPTGLFSSSDSYHLRRWKQVQYLADLFWTRWRREYLTLLQSRQKWSTAQRPIQEGDLVLVTDQNLPRNDWPLGRVVEVPTSADGRRRSAKIRIAKYRDSSVTRLGTMFMERPITKLILLRTTDELV